MYVDKKDLTKRLNKNIRNWILISLTAVILLIINVLNMISTHSIILSRILLAAQIILFIIAVLYLRKLRKLRNEVEHGV